MLQRNDPHDDQECATEHFAAALDWCGDGPADRDDQARTRGEQQCMPDRKPHGDSDGTRAPCRSVRIAAKRQRGNCHQVIRPEAVQKPQKQGGG
jgi:hypothetical protein